MPAEDQVELRAAAGRQRADGLDPEDAGHGVLERPRHRGEGLLDRQVTGARDDADAVKSDLGKDRHRHGRRRPQAGRDRQDRQAEDGDPVAPDKVTDHQSLAGRGSIGVRRRGVRTVRPPEPALQRRALA